MSFEIILLNKFDLNISNIFLSFTCKLFINLLSLALITQTQETCTFIQYGCQIDRQIFRTISVSPSKILLNNIDLR